MRILITGNRGFIGSAVQRHFVEEGHQVVGFDISAGFDILDAGAVERAMAGCDAVAHLAMPFGKDVSDSHVIAAGVEGTWNVLRAAERCGARRVVSYSSVNAMGIFMGEDKPDFLPLDESHPCRPGRAYGVAKYLGEEACRSFSLRTGIPTVCIRPPGVLSDESVEWIREQRLKDAEFEWTPYWEYGCFIHVDDLARATLCALICPDPGHVSLLVTADDISSATHTSRELVDRLLPDIEWRGGVEYEQNPFRSLADTTLARRVLGWAPRFHWRD
jgi:nucleoside-diphosphate-sugar epimerase